jgi:SAM-dependent methyltransferase
MSEQPGTGADGTYGGRPPTSHERHAGQPWDASYDDGPAPWDIGRPQPAIARLADGGAFTGTVLDAGCGTGDNAIHIAALGRPVLGFDVAESAVAIARRRAAEHGLDAEFVVADALRLDELDRAFDTVLDSALFHTFDDGEQRAYAASLASVTRRGGSLHLLCFSDVGDETGPHPVSERQLRAAFAADSGWEIVSISADRCDTRFAEAGVPAWLARITRV